MHPAEESPFRLFVAKEMIEQGSAAAESLLPAIGSFANRIGEIAPQRIEGMVGIDDIASQTIGAIGGEILLSGGRIGKGGILLLKKAE